METPDFTQEELETPDEILTESIMDAIEAGLTEAEVLEQFGSKASHILTNLKNAG